MYCSKIGTWSIFAQIYTSRFVFKYGHSHALQAVAYNRAIFPPAHITAELSTSPSNYVWKWINLAAHQPPLSTSLLILPGATAGCICADLT